MQFVCVRIFLVLAATAPLAVFAATPSSGTLSLANPQVTYASTFTQANPTFDPPTCSAAANRHCDDFALTVDLPAGYASNHRAGQIVITTTWKDPDDDFDLYLQNSSGAYVKTQANSGPSPEVIELPLSEVPGGGGTPVSFNIRIVLFSKGTGPDSGSASTAVVLDPGPSDPCIPPGFGVLVDPRDDQGAPGTSKQDIRYIAIAELGADTDTLAFTMKVTDLNGSLPANGIWRVYFTAPNGTTYWVSMLTDASATVSYSYGTRSGTTDTGVGAADSGSFSADGSITIKIAASRIGSPGAGQNLTGIFGRTYVLVGAAGSGTLVTTDSAPNTIPGTAQYTLVGNTFCPTPPPPSPCVLPGITVVSDPSGDQGSPGTSEQDIRYVAVAELGADTDTLAFTMKVTDLSGSLTASGTWSIYFTGTDSIQYWVSMGTDASSAVSYSYGTRSGTTDTRVGAADSGSFSADGSITIKIVTSKVGNPAAGQNLTAIFGRTYVRGSGPAGPGVLVTTDSAPNTIPGTAQYTLVGNTFCPPPPPTNAICAPPGLTKLTDTPGTGGTAPAGSAGPGMDLMTFSISQPYAPDGDIKLVFQIHTDPGVSPQPAGSAWYVSMKTPDGKVHGVRMFWNGPTPSFESYEASPSNAGNTDGRFVNAATIKAAEPSSSYDPDMGLVTMVVKATDLALMNPGDLIGGFNSAVTQTTGGVATATVDEMPNGLAHTNSFTLNDNLVCAPGNLPLASLEADVQEGFLPLTVTFTVTGSDADGDALETYTLAFGDGERLENQSFDGQLSTNVTHTYQNADTYTARLTVTDSTGAVSTNTDTSQWMIIVNDPNLPPVASAGQDFSVNRGQSVILNGAGSYDPEGGTLSYAWAQIAGLTVTLSNAGTATPSFTAPNVTRDAILVFSLTVSDPGGASRSDEIAVTVRSQVPLTDDTEILGGVLSSLSLLVLTLLCLVRGSGSTRAFVLRKRG